MQQKINTAILLLLCAIIAFIPLSGVKSGFRVQNVEKSAVVKSVGLDDRGEVKLSFVQSVIDDTSPSHAQAVIAAAGKDFSEAEQKAQILADKYLTLSYTHHFIFGMSTAEKGLKAALDFLLASPILQLSSYIYVCEGEAEEMLENISKDDISTDEVLTNLNLAGKEEGCYAPVTVLELAKSMSEGSCLPVPIIGQKQEGSNSAKKSVPVFKGYAVLRGGKLCAVMNRDLSLVCNLLNNRVRTAVCSCEKADVKLTRLHCTARVTFQDKQAERVRFDVSLCGRFGDLKGQNAASSADVKLCEAQVRRKLLTQMVALFDWCKENRLDVLNVRRQAEIQTLGLYPVSPEAIWQVPYEVNIHQKTDRSFPLNY